MATKTTKSKKAPAKKTAKVAKVKTAAKVKSAKKSAEFERAVRTATWCTVAFCVLEAIWATIGFGVDWLELGILAGIALLAFFLRAAHLKGNQRMEDGLAGVVTILVLVFQGLYLSYILPLFGMGFGSDFLATLGVILDIAMLIALIVFTCAHFLSVGKNSKAAILLNRRVNFAILLIGVCAMIVYAALYGMENGVYIVESICYYAIVIFATDLVQRLEEGK